jgi:hypothetical protein
MSSKMVIAGFCTTVNGDTGLNNRANLDTLITLSNKVGSMHLEGLYLSQCSLLPCLSLQFLLVSTVSANSSCRGFNCLLLYLLTQPSALCLLRMPPF